MRDELKIYVKKLAAPQFTKIPTFKRIKPPNFHAVAITHRVQYLAWRAGRKNRFDRRGDESERDGNE